ncbi:MAG TPA: carbamoyl phosphate synthase large subunit, partial [Arachnia sp.]|nr:carbamoyl phosphate synthase large subunit [Arachnia sp.]
ALESYIDKATDVNENQPVLVDRFLDDAVEIDVDALYDGTDLYIGGIMEHIEEAGIHSGDSACALPPITLGDAIIDQIRHHTLAIADGVGVRGLLNIQFALHADTLYVLEANPRASRTVPFVSKATNTALAKAAALIMLGRTIAELRADGKLRAEGDGSTPLPGAPIAVKEAVMPFNRFRTATGAFVDTLLGPEMRSTGEVMGLSDNFGTAYAKSQDAGGGPLPTSGKLFVSIADRDKRHAIWPIKRLVDLGFQVLATKGTASVLRRNGVAAEEVLKLSEMIEGDDRPSIVDLITSGGIDLIFNTPEGSSSGASTREDGYLIRTAAVLADIPVVTTVPGLAAATQGIEALQRGEVDVRSLQDWARG